MTILHYQNRGQFLTKLSQNAHETAKTPKNRRPSYLPKRHRRFALFGLTQNGQETKACQLLLNVESPEDITVRVNKSLRNAEPHLGLKRLAGMIHIAVIGVFQRQPNFGYHRQAQVFRRGAEVLRLKRIDGQNRHANGDHGNCTKEHPVFKESLPLHKNGSISDV